MDILHRPQRVLVYLGLLRDLPILSNWTFETSQDYSVSPSKHGSLRCNMIGRLIVSERKKQDRV